MERDYARDVLRKHLLAQRQALPGRDALCARLHAALLAWLHTRPDLIVGAYWPIRGEFDPLPALLGWARAEPARRLALPVVHAASRSLRWRAWHSACAMQEGAYGIPIPLHTQSLRPTLLCVPCVGCGPGGLRLGYGGGFYDRTLAAMRPRAFTLGLCFAQGFVAQLQAQPHDVALDAILTENGLLF